MKTAWICSPIIPEIERDAGSRRIIHTAQFLRELGFRVTLIAKSPGSGESAGMLEQNDVELIVGLPQAELNRAHAPDPELVVICYWHLAEIWLKPIRLALPNAKIVVDSMDLHFLRQTRKAFQRHKDNPKLLDPEIGFAYIRELNIFASADAVWTVSENEATLLNSFTGFLDLAVGILDCEDLPPSDLSFEARKGILFIGNFQHDPNRSAVEFLCRQIVPLIDRELLKEHPVMIVGNALDADIRKLAEGLEGIHMIGWTPSVLPHLHRCRVSVLPLLYGAGTKRKLIQSLMCGTPVVSTWIGTEGLNLEPGREVIVANEPQEFARWTERLLIDARLWNSLVHYGQAHVSRNHSRHAVRERIREELGRLSGMPPKPYSLAETAAIVKANWLKPHYQLLLERVRKAILTHTPQNSTLLVVSKGDAQLLQFTNRRAAHFPSDDRRNYTGYHPPNSEWCIRKLESAIDAEQTTFFVIPAPFLWWLEYYQGLKEYLSTSCRSVFSNPETCMVFELPRDKSRLGGSGK